VVLGDNGKIVYQSAGVLLNVKSTGLGIGGNDTINMGLGSDVVIGGAGADTINAGGGLNTNNVVLGDEGELQYATGLGGGWLEQAYSIDPQVGGNDLITIGGGNAVVIGGNGADSITTGDGTDVVLGDNGQIVYQSANALFTVQTTDVQYGGNDTITTGNGNDVILGGTGSDKITSGSGNDIVLGDNGQIDFGPRGVVQEILLTRAVTATQVINVPAGSSLLGGGADLTGTDFVLAGQVLADGSRNVVLANNANYAGSDTIHAGSGNNWLFGEGGNDFIYGGSGNNYIEGGGGSDHLDAGSGNSVLIGGSGINLAPGGGGFPRVLRGLEVLPGAVDAASVATVAPVNTVILPKALLYGSTYTALLTEVAPGPVELAQELSGPELAQHDYLLATLLDRQGGNDYLYGGSGNDVLIGDVGMNLSPATNTLPYVAGLNGIEAQAFGTDYTALSGIGARLGAQQGALQAMAGTLASLDATPGLSSALDALYSERVMLAQVVAGTSDTRDPAVFNDTMIGGSNVLVGGTGNSVLVGNSSVFISAAVDGWIPQAGPGGGQDVVASPNLVGGNDTITGGAGNDTIIGGNSVVIAAEANVSQQQVNGSGAHGGEDGGDGYYASSESGSYVAVHDVSVSGGSDVITGGSGNDTIIGDNSVVITEQVTLSSSVENVFVGDPAGATVVQPGVDLVSGINVVGGNDQIQGGTGNDLIAGDNSVVIAPVVTAMQNVVFQDAASVPLQLAAPGSESRESDPSYFVQSDLIDALVSGVNVTGGNDGIYGGTGNDLLFGGNLGIVVPVVTLTQTVTYSADAHGQPGWSEDFGCLDLSAAQLTALEHGVVRDVSFSDGADTIAGGAGNDGVFGDNGVLIEPLVAYDQSITYAGDGWHAEYQNVAPGAPGLLGDLVDNVSVQGGNDIVSGGAGNDLLAGDNLVLVTPQIDVSVTQIDLATFGCGDGTSSSGVGGNLFGSFVGVLRVTGGNDTIYGGSADGSIPGGSDMIAGDSRIVVAPVIDASLTTNLHEGGDGVVVAHDVLGALVLSGGNDTIDGGAGSNALVGDNTITVAAQETLSITVTGEHEFHSDDAPALQFAPVIGELYSVDGNDVIQGGAAGDVIVGDDALMVRPAVLSVTLNGTAVSPDCHEDPISALGGAEIQAGQDTIHGGAGNDTIVGDVLVVSGTADHNVDGLHVEQYDQPQHQDGGPQPGDNSLALFGHDQGDDQGEIEIVNARDTVYGGAGQDVIWGGSLTTGAFAGQAREQWSEAEPNGPLLFANDTGWFFKASDVLPFGELHGQKGDYIFGDPCHDALYGGDTAPAQPPTLHDDAAAGNVAEPTIDWSGSFFDAQGPQPPAGGGETSAWVGEFVNNLGQGNANAGIRVQLGVKGSGHS